MYTGDALSVPFIVSCLILIDPTLFCSLACSIFHFRLGCVTLKEAESRNESINQSIWSHQMLYTLVEGEGYKTIEMHP